MNLVRIVIILAKKRNNILLGGKMKKYNLFKVLAITVFVAWLLTLLIPGSYVDYTGSVTSTGVAGVGIWGLLSNLSISISYFNGIAVFLIALACFYAVLNKISVYNAFVSKTASIFKGKERLLVSIVTIIFGIISLFVSDFLILLVFAPFVYQVMKELEIDKKIILSSTLVAGLIGSMCGIYNNSLFTTFGLELNTLLLVKVILFVVSICVLIILIAPKSGSVKSNAKKTTAKTVKKSTKELVKEKKEKKVVVKTSEKKVNKTIYAVLTILFGTIGINKFYAGKVRSGILSILFCWTGIPTILSIAEFITVLTEKADKNGMISVTSSRRNNVLFGTSLVLFTLFIIGSIIPWESLIENCSLFSDVNVWLNNIKIGDYTIFGNIIGVPVVIDQTTGGANGTISVFGTFTMNDVAILLFILTLIIGVINKTKVNDFIATVTGATKKVLPIALTAMLISVVLIIMVTTGINVTIANAILKLIDGFNVATATLATMIGSFLTADFYYLISTVGTVFSATIANQDYYGVVAFIMQSVYNLMMIIAPTSVGLIIGLYYLDIPYNKWFKFIWKLLLILFVIIIITSIVIYVLV